MSRQRLGLILATSIIWLFVTHRPRVGAQDAAPVTEAVNTQHVNQHGDEEPADELTEEARKALAALRGELAGDSEARLMLEEIVKGKRLGPDDGWFRVAVSRTRYDWSTVATRYDRNANGSIERGEFPGDDADFRRLDRDRNSAVTAEDLNWQDHALARSPGTQLFRRADQDSNGKVTSQEFSQLFQQLDSGAMGYLSLDDLRDELREPADAMPVKQADRPSRSTLILGLARQEIGSLQPGPALGDQAPDFTLTSLDGTPVTLSEQIGSQPVVLIFGNFTCGPFRSHSANLEKLYRRYRDRAKFYLVYVREAHPSDGWWSLHNQRMGIDLAQPTTDQQRCDVAGQCRQHLEMEMPFLVDSVADTVGATYSGMPNRLYLLDHEGRVVFKSGRGPFGFKPGELEQALIWQLSERPTARQTSAETASPGNRRFP